MPTKSDKVWREAISKAIYEYDIQTDEEGKIKKVRYLNVVASQLVAKAVAGDILAMKEIGDRLDGKAVQAIEGDLKVTTRAVYHDPTAHLEETDGDSIH